MDNNQVKEAVAALMKDPQKREAFAQMLVEYIQPGHITTDFISMLLDSKSLKPGDSLVKKVRKGIKVYTLVPGAEPLRSEITISERMNYVLDGSIVSLTANDWELRSGELGTVESMKSEALAKLRDYSLNKVFTALSTIWTAGNTPNNYTSVGGAITSTALKAAINRINQTTGKVKAVVGTRKVLTPITEFGSFWGDGTNTTEIPDAVREVMQTGWLGKYYGAPIIALDQEYDNPEDYNALIPDDKILVIGENVGSWITYGDVQTTEYIDPRVVPPQWNFSMYMQHGMIIDNAQGIYVIDNLS